MEKVQDVNKKGTAFSSVFDKNLSSVLKLGLLGTGPKGKARGMSGQQTEEERKKTWIENVRKEREGVVFFNIIGPSGNDRGEPSTIKTASFNEGTTIIFDLSKFTPDFPLKTDQYGHGEGGEQKINTYRYGFDSYHHERPDKETARKNYEGDDMAEFNKNWRGYLPVIDKDYGFTLSFRVAPRLFKGLVIEPERKMNDQEIQKKLEEIEESCQKALHLREVNKGYGERHGIE